MTVTLVSQNRVECFGDDLQSKYYVFGRYFHVTKCLHFSIARLAEAYLDEPGSEWSMFLYRKENNTVPPYYADVTV